MKLYDLEYSTIVRIICNPYETFKHLWVVGELRFSMKNKLLNLNSIDPSDNEARKLEVFCERYGGLRNKGQNESKITDTNKSVGTRYEFHCNNWQQNNSYMRGRSKVK